MKWKHNPKDTTMRYFLILVTAALAACGDIPIQTSPEAAAQDRARHLAYLETVYQAEAEYLNDLEYYQLECDCTESLE
jgi:hypothetical protein